jgi:hypothetical protein
MLADKSPRDRGFIVEWVGEECHLDYDLLRKAWSKVLPTMDKRCSRWAEEVAMQSAGTPGMSPSAWMRAYMTAKQNITSADIERLRHVLVPEVGWDYLNSSDRASWLADSQKRWLTFQQEESRAKDNATVETPALLSPPPSQESGPRPRV